MISSLYILIEFLVILCGNYSLAFKNKIYYSSIYKDMLYYNIVLLYDNVRNVLIIL